MRIWISAAGGRVSAIARHRSEGNAERRRAILIPRRPVIADRDDRGGPVADDGGVASAGVTGTIGGLGADLLIFGDLVDQLGQHPAVAIAAG